MRDILSIAAIVCLTAAAIVFAGLWLARRREAFGAPPVDPNTFVVDNDTTKFPADGVKSHVVFTATTAKTLTLPAAEADLTLVLVNASAVAHAVEPMNGSVIQNRNDPKHLVLPPQTTVTLHANGAHWVIESDNFAITEITAKKHRQAAQHRRQAEHATARKARQQHKQS